MFLRTAESKLSPTKTNYQVNRNIAVSILQEAWIKILLSPSDKSSINQTIHQVIQLLIRYRYQRRIRPHTKRARKHMRANERYMTEKNYKPAF